MSALRSVHCGEFIFFAYMNFEAGLNFWNERAAEAA